jgi:hypothetical protein
MQWHVISRVPILSIVEISYLVRFEGSCRDGVLLLARSFPMTLLMQPHGKLGRCTGVERGFGEPLFLWRLWRFLIFDLNEIDFES